MALAPLRRLREGVRPVLALFGALLLGGCEALHAEGTLAPDSGTAVSSTVAASPRVSPRVSVDLLEDDVARVIRLDTGEALTVARARLPRGTREGDEVQLDSPQPSSAVTVASKARIHQLHESLAVPVPAGLDLDAPSPAPSALTARRER